MGYRTLRECVDDLERAGQLVRIESPIDAHLEAAEIQRRVYQASGPAIYFANLVRKKAYKLKNRTSTLISVTKKTRVNLLLQLRTRTFYHCKGLLQLAIVSGRDRNSSWSPRL